MPSSTRSGELPLEIAFLERHGVDRNFLVHACEIAARLQVSPDMALLGEGWISEKSFYTALAREIGAPYWDGRWPAESDTDYEAAILHGFAPLAPNSGGCRAVVAPRGAALRLLIESAAEGPTRMPIAIASRQKLAACLRAQFGDVMAERAANLVADCDPLLSAKTQASLFQILLIGGFSAAVALGAALAPALLRTVFSLSFWVVFSGTVWLRSTAIAARGAARAESSLQASNPALGDAALPIYTVIAPLFREGGVAAQLVRALAELDYPAPKLDIKLVVEIDDQETLAALAALQLPACYDVIVAPRGAPRTKPRALNMALAAARGELVTVYDAEDRPAPGQLRAAAALFAVQPEVDCVQAALTIQNVSDSWLAEMFAVEYAVLFDIFNPGLAALRLPMALGGTSNHFRLSSLRRASGWDAWNVTEDADLGIRMARLGMQVQTLGSDTIEEAPHELGNWFQQRVRWQKGWMQTLIVHSRDPFELHRQLGGWGALSAAALFVGGLSGGLFGTVFFGETLARLLASALIPGYSGLWYGDIVTIGLLLWGVQTLVIPIALAMRRRRIPGVGRVLIGMPLYFALITLASWRAMFDLVFRPYHWGKTEHGREKARFAGRVEDRASALPAGE